MAFKFKVTTTKGTTHVVSGERWRTEVVGDDDGQRGGMTVHSIYSDKERKKLAARFPLKNVVAIERV